MCILECEGGRQLLQYSIPGSVCQPSGGSSTYCYNSAVPAFFVSHSDDLMFLYPFTGYIIPPIEARPDLLSQNTCFLNTHV